MKSSIHCYQHFVVIISMTMMCTISEILPRL